jgi:hypothetical protein
MTRSGAALALVLSGADKIKVALISLFAGPWFSPLLTIFYLLEVRAGYYMYSLVFGVTVVLEAMCSHRPYRPSLGLENALEELETKRGTLYDPDVVDVTLCLYRGIGSLPK